MNLFTFNSKSSNQISGFVVVLCIFIGINLCIAALPPGSVREQFEQDIMRISQEGSQTDIFVFGDSRGAVLDEKYFSKHTLNLSAVSNTIAYSWLLLKKVYGNTNVRPKVIILVLDANNYNRNGIFTKRDYALSQVAGLRDIFSLFLVSGGVEYGIDGLFGRLVPIYGRRMEIRSPKAIMAQIVRLWEEVRGPAIDYKPTRPLVDFRRGVKLEEPLQNEFPKVVRRPHFDKKYYLTYKRSVYSQYELSRLHLQMLEEVVELSREHDAFVFLIQLPIEKKLFDLQQHMVGNKLDIQLTRIAKKNNVSRLDLRKRTEFEFIDINHLSPKGSASLIKQVINPAIQNI